MTDSYRTLSDDRFDVVVIGAGAGGLTAAALLAQRGRKVLVVDQHYVVGGNMSAFRRPHYRFDVGLHYVGGCHEGGFLPNILRAAGAGSVVFEPMASEGFDTLVLPGLTFEIPRGIEAFRAKLLATFPKEARGIHRYVDMMCELARLQQTVGSPLALLAALPRIPLLWRWRNKTLEQFLDTCTEDRTLRAVLAGQHLDYALPPSQVTAVMGVLLPLHMVESGGYYPRGGGQAVADALRAAIEAKGGQFLLRARVQQVLVEKGRATGVRVHSKHLGERVIRAPVVVSNADVKRTYLELVGPEQLKADTVKRVESYEMAPGLGSVYVGLRGDLRESSMPRANFWVQPELELEDEYARVARGEMVERPSIIISIASLKDPHTPGHARPGTTNLQIMALAPTAPKAWGVDEAAVQTGDYRRRPAYLAAKQRYATALLRMAEQVLPQLRDGVEYQEVATPLTQRRYTLSTSGTSYGIASTPAQSLLARPDTKTEIAGLYLCGASCRAGHGIVGAMLSGLLAASHIVGFRLVREVMRPDPKVARMSSVLRGVTPPAS